MRRPWLLLGLLVVLASLPATAAEWMVDPARSTLAVEFAQGGKPIMARFESFQAKVRFEPADLAGSQVEIVVDLASFRSGDAQRDQMATASEFLAAANVGTATYRTTAFEARGNDRYEVTGELSLKGITGLVSHPATITVGPAEASARGEAVLNRVEFGVGAAQFPRGDQVGLAVIVRFDLAATRTG